MHLRSTEDLDRTEEFISELQAQNTRLFDALQLASNELEFLWKQFEIGDELPREIAKSTLSNFIAA